VSIGFSGSSFNFGTGRVDVLTRLQQEIAGQPFELGGSVESTAGNTNPGALQPTLTWVHGETLMRARLRVTIGPTLPGPHDQIIENGGDPVSALRAAIAEGRAHEAGSAEVSGQSALRIDFDLPQGLPADSPPVPANHPTLHAESYAYVDRQSFRPVEIVYGLQTYRFLAYEYLPATPANLALTDIRRQHPGARVLDTVFRRSRPRGGRSGR
jgi:hypothetical protein